MLLVIYDFRTQYNKMKNIPNYRGTFLIQLLVRVGIMSKNVITSVPLIRLGATPPPRHPTTDGVP